MLRALADRSMRAMLASLMYFPAAAVVQTPADAGVAFEELELATVDGQRLGAWWVPAGRPSLGHVIFCHGNAGNIGDRAFNAALLSSAGFDVLLFDYRGYGRSTGAPDEAGTYRDARAARSAVLARRGVDAERVFYLGESLGGAIALELAVEFPPRGLILQSTFTSIRQIARRHYRLIPTALVPDAYPSIRLIAALRSPLLVLHGDRDEIVPLAHGRALYGAAPGPKRMRVFSGAGHNDLVARAQARYVGEIADWAAELGRS